MKKEYYAVECEIIGTSFFCDRSEWLMDPEEFSNLDDAKKAASKCFYAQTPFSVIGVRISKMTKEEILTAKSVKEVMES